MECGVRIKLRFAGVLKIFAGDNEIDIEMPCGSSIKDLIAKLGSSNPKLLSRLMSGKELMPDIYIAVNDVDVRLLKDLATPLKDGDTVLFLSYIHGG